jgi:hypothetical protein
MSITLLLCCCYMWYMKTPYFPLGMKEVRWLLVARGFGGFFGVFGMYCKSQSHLYLQGLRLCQSSADKRNRLAVVSSSRRRHRRMFFPPPIILYQVAEEHLDYFPCTWHRLLGLFHAP